MLEGEAIDNGITVDEAGGIYVVTSKYMRKLVWDGSKLSDRESDGAWKSGYDYVPNPRAFSRGAGNTPTLMGFGPDEQHLVIIADAGDPVKIVAFWRDEIPKDFKQHPETRSRRIAGQLPLSIKVPATIEWSPHVYGYGTMMFASAWPDPVKADGKLDLYSTVMSAGVSRRAPRGSEKFIWDPKTYSFKSAWTTDYGMQWALHPISTATHTVHLAELKKGSTAWSPSIGPPARKLAVPSLGRAPSSTRWAGSSYRSRMVTSTSPGYSGRFGSLSTFHDPVEFWLQSRRVFGPMAASNIWRRQGYDSLLCRSCVELLTGIRWLQARF
jgi:hypothetical protein